MILKLRFNNSSEFEDFFFGPNAEKEHIYNAIVAQIKEALEKGLEAALFAEVIFKHDPLMVYLELPKQNWMDSLTNALRFYEQCDLFEECIEITKIIKKLDQSGDQSS